MTDTKPEVKRLTMLYTGLEVVPASDYDSLAAKVRALEGERDEYNRQKRHAAELERVLDEYKRDLANALRDLKAAEDQAAKNCDEVLQLRRDLEAARGELEEKHRQLLAVEEAFTNARGERDAARKGLAAVETLMRESNGVDGLHLNGDVATWDELRTGGKFEEWLIDFDAALSQPTPQAGEEPKCPRCGVSVMRPKCLLELSPDECPRHELAREYREE